VVVLERQSRLEFKRGGGCASLSSHLDLTAVVQSLSWWFS